MSTKEIDRAKLPHLNKRFFVRAGASGLGGGAALAGVMMVSDATRGMGATSIFSQCFASFIWPTSAMSMNNMPTSTMPTSTMPTSTMPTSTMPTSTMPTSTMPTSTMPTHHSAEAMGTVHGVTAGVHAVVGALIHFALSASLGVVILSIIVLAGSVGWSLLAKPAGIIGASIIAGAMVYGIVARGIAPSVDPAFGSGLSQSAFFLAHLLFGSTVGILGGFWVWRPPRSRL